MGNGVRPVAQVPQATSSRTGEMLRRKNFNQKFNDAACSISKSLQAKAYPLIGNETAF
jgi:hypothetical protein